MAEKRNREYTYLLELLSCALHGRKAENRLEQADGEKLYQAAVFHGVEVMAFDAVRDYLEPESGLHKKWGRQCENAFFMELYQLAEYEEITRRFTEAGIRFMPLKGLLMKPMYGNTGYREMGDLDILIEKGKGELCRSLMTGMGYQTAEFAQSNHDSYQKGYVRVELHESLLPRTSKWYHPYFESVMERAHPSPDNECLLLPDETDFYLFHVVHFAKHYYGKGSGIRSLMDIFINIREGIGEPGTAGRAVLHQMQLEDFEKKMRRLSEKCFSDKEECLDEEEQETLEILFQSGMYGSPERRSGNQVRMIRDQVRGKTGTGISEMTARKKYFWSMVFLKQDKMEVRYPFLKNCPCLLPVFWLIRALKVVIWERDKLKEQWETFMK